MTDSAKQPPVYFRALELENVRCFGESQSLSLADADGNPVQWTLILGDNGVGKTTLLQCLAWMRPVRSDVKPKLVTLESALSNEENSTLKSLIRIGNDVRANLEASFSVGRTIRSQDREADAKDVKTGIVLRSKGGKLEQATPSRLTILASTEFERIFPFDLVIFAYGATRRSGTLKLEGGELSDSLASIFRNSAELYDAEDVLLNLDYRAAKSLSDRDKRRLQQVMQVLATILPDVRHKENIHILGPEILGNPSEPSGVQFKTPYGVVPLSALSLGYQTTLTWIADLALRLYERYPDSPDPLSEPGIVLIDNIELHLHPRWQRRMMEDLSRCFPAIQFVATAHSPLVVQAAESGNLAVLREINGQVAIKMHSESVNAWRADQILASDLFGVPSRSREIEKLVVERNALLDKASREPDEDARLSLVEKKLDRLRTAEDPEDQAAMNLIRRVAAKMRDSGSNLS